MKGFIRFFLGFALIISLFSCKDTNSGKSKALFKMSGTAGEVLVIMDANYWKGALGDSVKNWFQQPQFGLPQGEPMFNVINVPHAAFKGVMLTHRNVLVVNIDPKFKKSSVSLKDEKWSKSQKYFEIDVSDSKSFLDEFNKYKNDIINTFIEADRMRIVEMQSKQADVKLSNEIEKNYNIKIVVPEGYRINKDLGNFLWTSLETKVNSRGIILFTEEYLSENQLEQSQIVTLFNEKLKADIPGPLDGSYMALDVEAPMMKTVYQYKNKYYAVEIRGLWTVVNDFMAGPFIINAIVDSERNRVVYVMGYVYAPDEKKRNLLRQVEGVLQTLDFVKKQ
jgi:hypothetical protein